MPTTINHWAESRCARAFWNQHEMPPYQQLLRDTAEMLEPAIGERWLDLGCGSGQLSRALWEKSEGKVEAIVGVDVAEINARAFADLRERLTPTPTPMCLRFVARDFSPGFADWPGDQFDGVVAGMSLHYAESYCDESGQWNETGYDRVLNEVYRLLKPGGTFVFSVHVPNPALNHVAWQSLAGTFSQSQPLSFLKNAYRMWSYGSWLKRESRRGRFHYLRIGVIAEKLTRVGFVDVEHRLSCARQAYLIRCWK